ncbi:YdcH family protein [Blastochloris viridis]|uniref:DUF465 domain-containing protein n=1 Tax=Blastochloris viridis TaxID=1079 RepID=A0A0H5BCN6_BLAVI|nr:DUF465 domain-containing protein [Blastochloris viridis]ALK10117.1 hypothetical protein BVIR_2350 [Blastochloris viridis]BAR99955.1 hypothetical protein BV133_2362 [Blastochloris viridis]CUU42781.1 hypothetical protein BVIRIDIS_17960 [Blastochloris viridis]
MSHIPHELKEEFPADAETIRHLASENPQFAALTKRYDIVNAEIHRIEGGEDAASDTRWEELKKERLHLKDSIFAQLVHLRNA